MTTKKKCQTQEIFLDFSEALFEFVLCAFDGLMDSGNVVPEREDRIGNPVDFNARQRPVVFLVFL